MKIKYSKKIDPKNTKPTNDEALVNFNNKLNDLANTIQSEDLIEIKCCLVCQSKQLSKVFSSRNFDWMECRECGHYQKKAMPSYNDLLKAYQKDTVENYLDEIGIEFRLENIAIPKYNFIKDFVRKNNNKRWFDIASGLGDLPFYLKKEGWEVESTEIYEPFIKFAQDKLSINHHNLLLDSYFKMHRDKNVKNFDVVTALGYFDIIPNPLEHAKIVNNLLEDDGILAINQPMNDSVTGFMSKLFPDDSLRQNNPMDYSVYCKNSIFKLFNLAGFEVVGVWYHGLDCYEMFSKLMQKKDKSSTQKNYDLLLNLFNEIQSVIDKHELSDLLIICAKKVKHIKL